MVAKTPKPPEKKTSAPVLRDSKGSAATAKHGATGLVSLYVHRPAARRSASRLAPSKVLEKLEAGLPVGELDDLQAALGIPMERLAPMLGISKATLHRRRAGQVLETDESDRVVRYARLTGFAVDVFESLEDARRWLNSPQVGLGGEVPLDYARTEVGAREVENLLGRIEHGVHS